MTYEDKIKECRKAAFELCHFPVLYRKDRPIENQKRVKTFSDGCDIGTWIQDQKRLLKNGELKKDREELFTDLLKLEDQFFNIKLCKNIKEATEIIKKNKFIPVKLTKKSKNTCEVLSFSDGSDIGQFIEKCKKYIREDKLDAEMKAIVYDFLNLKKYYVNRKFKARLDEIKNLIIEHNFIPVSIQPSSAKTSTISFSNGVDVGLYLLKLDKRYKEGKLNYADSNYYRQFLLFKEHFSKQLFISKMRELVAATIEINDFPSNCCFSKSYNSKIRKFSTGEDMGYFFYNYKKKLEKDKLNPFEKRIFSLYIDRMSERVNTKKKIKK